jgi:hypothetical protein
MDGVRSRLKQRERAMMSFIILTNVSMNVSPAGRVLIPAVFSPVSSTISAFNAPGAYSCTAKHATPTGNSQKKGLVPLLVTKSPRFCQAYASLEIPAEPCVEILLLQVGLLLQLDLRTLLAEPHKSDAQGPHRHPTQSWQFDSESDSLTLFVAQPRTPLTHVPPCVLDQASRIQARIVRQY